MGPKKQPQKSAKPTFASQAAAQVLEQTSAKVIDFPSYIDNFFPPRTRVMRSAENITTNV